MQPALLEVNFADSSDDDYQHAARMELVADSAQPVNGHEPLADDDDDTDRTPSQWSRLWNRVYHGAAQSLGYALGDPREAEPFGTEARDTDAGGALVVAGNGSDGGGLGSQSPRASEWGYGVFGSSVESTHGTSSRNGDSFMSRDDPYDRDEYGEDGGGGGGSVAIDLRNTILQYQYTPVDFYMNLILATLKSGSVVIDGGILSAAAGSPLLMKTCLDSGCVDENDPAVQAIVQREINKVLEGDPYEGCYVAAEQADYLNCLVHVRNTTITNEQLVLMRYSGFEFIRMLHANPHLYAGHQTRQHLSFVLFRALTIFNLVSAWVGIVAELTLSAATIWSAVFWFRGDAHKTNNGYWTIICYVFGFVVSIVATSVSEQTKIMHYDNERHRFPDNRLKFIPLLPLYQFVLMFSLFRYERIDSRSDHFVIRYDLRNAIALQQIFTNTCFAIPQILIQSFLQYDRVQQLGGHFGQPCFWLLVGGGGACFLVAVFAMMRVVVFAHSCNSVGFAFMHVEPNNASHFRRLFPSDMVTRFLVYTIFCMCVSTLVMLICFLFNLENCNGGGRTYLSIFVGVAGVTVVLTVLITLFVPFSRLIGLLALPCVIMQIAFFPFSFPQTEENQNLAFSDSCTFFRYAKSAYLAPQYAVFGFTAVVMLVWIVMCVVELFSGKRIRQKRVDYFVE